MNHKKAKNKFLKHTLTAPLIWIPIIPIAATDLFLEIFHRIAFPIYGLPLVKRSQYIKIDRHKLKYLTFSEKLSCVYCGYVNGFAAYFVRVAGDTENYWCGIKHKQSKDFKEPEHHKNFLEYNNKKEFEMKYN
jgi:hypothetical protein